MCSKEKQETTVLPKVSQAKSPERNRIHRQIRCEEQKRKQEASKANEKRMEQQRRRQKYGEIVHEMFPPTIDAKKAQEVNVRNPSPPAVERTLERANQQQVERHQRFEQRQKARQEMEHSILKKIDQKIEIYDSDSDEERLAEIYADAMRIRFALLKD